jgi:hypothetical protein
MLIGVWPHSAYSSVGKFGTAAAAIAKKGKGEREGTTIECINTQLCVIIQIHSCCDAHLHFFGKKCVKKSTGQSK